MAIMRWALRFNLAVSEYLKGTGPSNIVAIWVHGHSLRDAGRSRRTSVSPRIVRRRERPMG